MAAAAGPPSQGHLASHHSGRHMVFAWSLLPTMAHGTALSTVTATSSAGAIGAETADLGTVTIRLDDQVAHFPFQEMAHVASIADKTEICQTALMTENGPGRRIASLNSV